MVKLNVPTHEKSEKKQAFEALMCLVGVDMKLQCDMNEFPRAFERYDVLPDDNHKDAVYHWHTGNEFLFVENGALRMSIGKRTYDLRMGDGAFIKNGDLHTMIPRYGLKAATVVSARFPASVFDGIKKFDAKRSFIVKASTLDDIGISEYVSNAKNGIETELANQSKYSDVLADNYALQLYLLMLRAYVPANDIGTVISADYESMFGDFDGAYHAAEISARTMDKFRKALDYVNEEYTDPELSLAVLSDVSGLSEGYISELFPAILGIQFKQYLNALRIDNAIRLISERSESITQAAFNSGFETIRNFNKVFKKLKGVAPSELKNAVSGNACGIMTGFTGLCPDSDGWADMVFVQNGHLSPSADPDSPERKVFGAFTRKPGKIWTSFNVNMLFAAGSRYRVSCDVYLLTDTNSGCCEKATVGVNMYYGTSESNPVPHAKSLGYAKTGEWVHCETEVDVGTDYVPGLYDKFSVFIDPRTGYGFNFLINNVTCEKMIQ